MRVRLPGCLRERWYLLKKGLQSYWPQQIYVKAALTHANVSWEVFDECWQRKVSALDSEKRKDAFMELLKTARWHIPNALPNNKLSPEILKLRIWFVRQVVASEDAGAASAMEPPRAHINTVRYYPSLMHVTHQYRNDVVRLEHALRNYVN